ncbi:CapA family protein [Sphingobacterium alkalisoli]|uniref:CapA family protein n=1 Tax=Sphingobacterium alkalisoli TaxID=1874115 RepID=A0A4U0H838_9SPHI|nr:CapA family protein [Sphingobacterium alkalisoli]TJY68045.1 CapA family protein [Sphingobacterium alkalisoli]GGH09441.1 hypothetical protein GCM10011418_07430 [Sphingobacterium alkalisoli]
MKVQNPKHRLLFVGDVVMDSSPEICEDIRELFQQCVIRSCNVEAPLNGFGKAIHKTGPLLTQNSSAAEELQKLGFNIFSMANNHICDYGSEGLFSTINSFPKDAILGVGTEKEAYLMRVKIVDNVRYGFVAYGENGYGAIQEDVGVGYAWVNHPSVNSDLNNYKSQVDILIVQVHAGVEMIDIPIPEWRSRYKEILDNGADVVIGHHPHVVQGVEQYDGKYIFYSLGNFYFDYESKDPRWNIGAILELEIENKKVRSYCVSLTRKIGNKLCLEQKDKSEKSINVLSNKILSSDYVSQIDAIAVEQWHLHHRKYYANPLNGFANYSFKGLAKHIKRLFFNRRVDYSMIWHNLFIESNEWLVKRAIKAILNKK